MGIESSYFVVLVREESWVTYHHSEKGPDGEWHVCVDDGGNRSSCSLLTQCADLDSAQRERNRCKPNAVETRVDPDDPTSPMLSEMTVRYSVVKWCELVEFIASRHRP